MKTLSKNGLRTRKYSAKEPDRHQFHLADVLNRYFQVGCKTFTRHELLAYGEANQISIENCLHAWKSRGFVRILKPLAEAADSEIVIELLHRIESPALLNPIHL